MSYVGARNIKELQDNPEFIQITQAGYSIESATRVRIDE
jgi:IMP dehydrogenase/GMP reductase